MNEPRACKTHICDFDHLSLAEVAEIEGLERVGKQNLRWLDLAKRRVFPDRGHNKGNAA